MRAVSETYAIINIADIDKVIFSEIPETRTSIRKSIDGTEFVIKYNSTPSFILDGSVTPIVELSHTNALSLMGTEEWTKEPEQLIEE